jgi:hypothetical protein
VRNLGFIAEPVQHPRRNRKTPRVEFDLDSPIDDVDGEALTVQCEAIDVLRSALRSGVNKSSMMSMAVPEAYNFVMSMGACGFVAVAIVFVEGRLYHCRGYLNLDRANRVPLTR